MKSGSIGLHGTAHAKVAAVYQFRRCRHARLSFASFVLLLSVSWWFSYYFTQHRVCWRITIEKDVLSLCLSDFGVWSELGGSINCGFNLTVILKEPNKLEALADVFWSQISTCLLLTVWVLSHVQQNGLWM